MPMSKNIKYVFKYIALQTPAVSFLIGFITLLSVAILSNSAYVHDFIELQGLPAKNKIEIICESEKAIMFTDVEEIICYYKDNEISMQLKDSSFSNNEYNYIFKIDTANNQTISFDINDKEKINIKIIKKPITLAQKILGVLSLNGK